jgi:TRAP-type mannitol/chloroaromatic compound transport system permease small subunit
MKLSGAVPRAASWTDKSLTRMTVVFSLLVLPLAALLFAQWPLRELVQAYSRQANDAAQILFALYVAVAVTAASRSHAHLASLQPHPCGAPRPAWQAWALLACVTPWALFMLWAGWPLAAASLASLERFGETLTPGYFLIKLAMMLLLVLVLVEGVLELLPHGRTPGSP